MDQATTPPPPSQRSADVKLMKSEVMVVSRESVETGQTVTTAAQTNNHIFTQIRDLKTLLPFIKLHLLISRFCVF